MEPATEPPTEPPDEEPPVIEPEIEPPIEPPAEEPPVTEPEVEPPAEAPGYETTLTDAPPLGEPPVTEPSMESQAEPAAAEAGTPPQSDAKAETPAEPAMLDVWRLGALLHRREPRRPRAESSRGDRPPAAEKRRYHAKARAEDDVRHTRRHDRGRHEAEVGRPEPVRREAKPRGERAERPRERPVDPDNPFAALAALKVEMEKNRRE